MPQSRAPGAPRRAPKIAAAAKGESSKKKPARGPSPVVASAGAGTRAEFQIPSLDGLRAISFLIVFTAHLGFDKIIPGGFGVTVFFFLSGFLITTLLRMEQEKHGAISLKQFYLRRALRILPPFYLVLTLALALHATGVFIDPLAGPAVLAQFLHYYNYWIIAASAAGTPDGTVVYWSLAVEEHFYLLFPLGFMLLQARFPGRWQLQGKLLLGVCGLALLWRLALVHGGDASSERIYFGSDTRADAILFGCALALLANPALEPRRVAGRFWRPLVPLAVAALLGTFVFRAPWFRDTLRYTVQGLALIPIFVVAIRDPRWGVMRLLNHPIARHIGVLSYSLYLLHLIVINALYNTTGLPPWVVAPLALAISLAGAQAIHRWVEQPCARLRRRLGRTATASPFRPKDTPARVPLPVPAVVPSPSAGR